MLLHQAPILNKERRFHMQYSNKQKSLSEQAADAGIPLKQLCNMILNKEIDSNINFIGSQEFNDRLYDIYLHSNNNVNKMYDELEDISNKIKSLTPLFKQDLDYIFKSENKDISSNIDILSKLYPIYPRAIDTDDYPYLKIPSINIVLKPIDSFYIDLNEIEHLLDDYINLHSNDDINLHCAMGDYNNCKPINARLKEITDEDINSCTITICCEFPDLKDIIYDIINLLNKYNGINHCHIVFKPAYLQKNTSNISSEEFILLL